MGLLGLAMAAALLLGLNVRGWRDRVFMRSPKPQIQALAVLPLTNLSGDPEQEYFADGMTEALPLVRKHLRCNIEAGRGESFSHVTSASDFEGVTGKNHSHSASVLPR